MAMTVGEVAARAGVPVATVRYYERRGLLARPARTRAGYRQYGPEAARRLRFIKRAQEMGFSRAEIAELLELRADDPEACPVVEARTREKIVQVERKLRELERLRTALEDLAASCRSRTPTGECPILEILTDEVAHA